MTDDETVDPDVSSLLDRIEAVRSERREAEAAVAEHGEETVRRVAAAYRDATALLDRYEDTATGTGNFEAYVELQEKFPALVEELPEDLPERESFEAAEERLDRRRLSDGDFENAREALRPAGEYVDLLDRRESARDRAESVRREADRRRKRLAERAIELEDLAALGEADLEAPVEEIRDPVEAYNERVHEDFQRYKRESPAREVLSLPRRAASFPLVDYRPPPSDLVEYVEDHPTGDEPIPKLLEYADYSASKLDHYVDDTAALQTAVAVHRTYLERLDASPLEVAWPPDSAAALRKRAGEVTSLLGRFADPETVALLRTVRDATRRDDYERLRTAARAREELTDEQLERLRSGAVQRELDRIRDARDSLAAALSESADDGPNEA
jgi:hypothetical protein